MEKASITSGLVSDLVAMQFPQWAHLPVTPVDLDGNDNTTFRLGDELSVRLPSAEDYVPQVAKEHRWLPLLAPHLPLPIPEPVARGDPALGFPRPWSVYRWLSRWSPRLPSGCNDNVRLRDRPGGLPLGAPGGRPGGRAGRGCAQLLPRRRARPRWTPTHG